MRRTHITVLLASLALIPLAAFGGDGERPHGRGQHWAALDTDGDGAISQAEAEAGAPRMAENFGQIDADGDGRITREEMHERMRQHRSMSREERQARADEHFRSADTNGDGAIDLAEAQNGMPRAAEHFADIDADGNGLLTREEMRTAAQVRRAERHRDRQPPGQQ